jgi:hypothetical protein
MENVWEIGFIVPFRLKLSLRRFSPGKLSPGTHWIRRWMGPTAGLEIEVAKKKKEREIFQTSSIPQPHYYRPTE